MATTAFGDFLRFYRLRLALTQEGLAERTGVSVRALSDMERGRARNPQRRTVELLVAGLGLTADEAGEFTALARTGGVAGDRPQAIKAGAVCALPPMLTELTGREAEQRALEEFACDTESSPGLQVAVVHGSPGVGKTALAVAAGHRLAGRFGNGAVFLDLRGMDAEPLTPDRAVHRLLRGFGVDERGIPVGLDDRLALYRSLFYEREVLLVLDNAANEAQVRPLLATSPGSVVLVTSRNTLAGLSARHRLRLALLDTDRAVELLGVVAGADRVTAEPEAARQVATSCGGVPLALLIAGNRLASRTQWTVAHLAGQLADERRRLSVLTAGDLQVRATFEISYHHLDPGTARMFRLLALAPGPDTSADLAAVLSGQAADVAEAALEELADAGLLGISDTPGRYTTHDLLRVYARERVELEESPEEAEAAVGRMRDWLLAVATKAALFFDHDRPEVAISVDGPDPVSDRESADQWLAREQANWLGALRAAAARGEHRKVLDLAEAVHWYSDLRGTGAVWREVFEAGVAASRALGEAGTTATQLNCLSWAFYALCGQPREALAASRLAEAAAVEAGDTLAEAWTWYYRSAIERRLSSSREAVDLVRRSVELFERAGHPIGRNLALSLLGAMLHLTGDFGAAIAANRLAEAHFRSLPSTPGNDELLAMVLTRLADSLAAADDVSTALELLDEAEKLFRGHGVTTGLARVRYMRGRALIRAGRLAEAQEQLMSTLDESRWSEARIEILMLLAEVADKSGEATRAREHRVRALAECGRYDTPEVRATAGTLAAELGIGAS